jgi:hypothetical protein
MVLSEVSTSFPALGLRAGDGVLHQSRTASRKEMITSEKLVRPLYVLDK